MTNDEALAKLHVPYIEFNAGSWAENGYRGNSSDLVMRAFCIGSDGTRRPDEISVDPLVNRLWRTSNLLPLDGTLVVFGLRVQVDSELPAGTIQFRRGGRVVAELQGFTR